MKHKQRNFTVDNFLTELCSVIELLPFVMPSISESFTDYIMTSIILPYNSSGIIEGIQDHFEIEKENINSDNDGEKNEYVCRNDDRLQQTSLKVIPAVKEFAKNANVNKVKGRKRTSSTGLTSSERKEKKPASRWDFLNNHEGDANAVKEGRSTRTCTKNNSAQQEKVTSSSVEPPESNTESTKLLFQREIKVQLSSHNPLLANGRGTYIGRHLGNNGFVNEVKMSFGASSKSGQVKVMNRSTSKSIGEKELTTVESRREREGKRERDNVHGRERPNAIANLGSAASFFRGNLKIGKELKQKQNAHVLIQNRKEEEAKSCVRGRAASDNFNSNLHGAALLAARAGNYLRRKTKR